MDIKFSSSNIRLKVIEIRTRFGGKNKLVSESTRALHDLRFEDFEDLIITLENHRDLLELFKGETFNDVSNMNKYVFEAEVEDSAYATTEIRVEIKIPPIHRTRGEHRELVEIFLNYADL